MYAEKFRERFETVIQAAPFHGTIERRKGNGGPYELTWVEAAWQFYSLGITDTSGDLVSGFYEELLPVYAPGPPTHELQELATADELNLLVSRLKVALSKISGLQVTAETFRKLELLFRNGHAQFLKSDQNTENFRQAIDELFAVTFPHLGATDGPN